MCDQRRTTNLRIPTYRARKAASNLDLVTVLDWNVAADGLVDRIDVFSVFEELIDVAIHINVYSCAPI